MQPCHTCSNTIVTIKICTLYFIFYPRNCCKIHNPQRQNQPLKNVFCIFYISTFYSPAHDSLSLQKLIFTKFLFYILYHSMHQQECHQCTRYTASTHSQNDQCITPVYPFLKFTEHFCQSYQPVSI